MPLRRFEEAMRIPPKHYAGYVYNNIALAFFIYVLARAATRAAGFTIPYTCSGSILPVIQEPCIETVNWLVSRISTLNSAHAWAWILIGLIGLFVSFYPRPVDGVRGGAIASMLVAYHELTWYLAWFVAHPTELTTLSKYMFFWIFLIAIVLFSYKLGYTKDISVKALFTYSIPWYVFLIGWVTAGFPITLNLDETIPVLYESGIGDLVELGSWLLVSSAMMWTYIYKQGLLEIVKESRGL